jgi:hypothetical protein
MRWSQPFKNESFKSQNLSVASQLYRCQFKILKCILYLIGQTQSQDWIGIRTGVTWT